MDFTTHEAVAARLAHRSMMAGSFALPSGD
jgi:hypothetical protein